MATFKEPPQEQLVKSPGGPQTKTRRKAEHVQANHLNDTQEETKAKHI
jgi:hypothetical protein